MNRTIVRLTAQGMLGGRRLWLLGALALLLVVIAVATRLLAPVSEADAAALLRAVAFSTFLPLFGLIVGTGAIAPEIDDGSIVHLLAKPVSRHTIVQSKLLVAVGAVVALAVVPTMLAAAVLGAGPRTVLAFGAGALAAGAVYSVLFLLLTIVTRHAVIIGLVYALIWESLVGSFVPGARNLSVQQWALSVTESIAPSGLVTADVGLGLAYGLIVGGFVAATWYAGSRLNALTLTSEE
ncbi:ABC-2 type transport system permease protein [Isoptericola sp. CG 20/1183]|uniref:ABC-2 type transport system permease protein n=1 Tax=Isoptericola halotolerans TaxID=300560 RepID=A0ABX5E9W2_9MICO|nr:MULTISPECIES: ABC transporter permease subunit [Isoptericola]MCK0118309.1 ABC transporter permease subunit [Isoptericola sp. S6320L]PRZ03248.1 ABC-2 type transport system permease protein [Isoptericola sp. CG 20/1183]PRZ03540.1 ABC-2 type transport system permease protein [Isoptericola halotolerans]